MKSIRLFQITVYVFLFISLILLGCSPQEQASQPAATDPPTKVAAAADPAAGLAALKGKVFSTGPHGEAPTISGDVVLTDKELQQIRDMQATAAIFMHYGDNDWSNAAVAGVTTQFEVMGIKVIKVTDANFDGEKQTADIHAVMAEKPDIIIAHPLAPAEVFKEVADQGVKLVFFDNVPTGLKQGQDYVSVVSADSYGNGITSAHLMAKALGGQGTVGLIYHDADFFVTQQRYEAFKKTIETDYPNIKIVAEEGVSGPDFAGDAEKATAAMLTNHADLDGIWAVWDVPAEGVMAAAQAAGRKDLVITTIDMGLNAAMEIARDGMIKGLGAQRPFDQGVTMSKLAGYGLLNKPAPEYVVLTALPVTKDDVLKAWQIVYHQSPPKELVNAAK